MIEYRETDAQRDHLLTLAVALESGDYQQTFGRLRNGYCYCAEGVAFDLMPGNGWANGIPTSGRAAFLVWYGRRLLARGEPDLVGMNDRQRLSFPEIATRLRRYFELPGGLDDEGATT